MNVFITRDNSRISVPHGVPELLRDLIQEKTGIFFDDSRLDIMIDKLVPLISENGFGSFMDLYFLLKNTDGDASNWQRVVESISVQETYFWREMDQVDALVDVLVPQWFEKSNERLRIWSAACATGEEAYTIAIALEEAHRFAYPIEIIASDASLTALTKARAGIYRERSFRSLPAGLRNKYFTKVEEGWQLAPSIRKRVRFEHANIVVRRDVSYLANSPVIFCRNVFIYFSQDSIRRTLGCFAQQMPPGGHLFVGASESLLRLTNEFELQQVDGAFVYIRHSH